MLSSARPRRAGNLVSRDTWNDIGEIDGIGSPLQVRGLDDTIHPEDVKPMSG